MFIATETEIFKCPYFKMGYCHASLECDTSDESGECVNVSECKYRKQLMDD